MDRKKIKYTFMRTLSIVCVMAICLAFFAGCNGSVSDEKFSKLEKDFMNLNAELALLQNNYDDALEQNEALGADNKAAKSEIEALNAQNAEAEKQIEDLKESNGSYLADIDALKGDNAAAKAEIEALKEQLNGLIDYVNPDSTEEKIRIYIDQGHNPTDYHNSGAIGNGLFEQDLTFKVGQLLAGLLLLDGRFEVRLSRPVSNTVLGSDNEGSLEARVNGAKEFEADYFISLHANAHSNADANGCEVLVADLSGDSSDLAGCVLSGIIASTELKNRGVKESPKLYVLKNAAMPAILVEMGFITNEKDAALLANSPQLFAQGIYDGILDYFDLDVQ